MVEERPRLAYSESLFDSKTPKRSSSRRAPDWSRLDRSRASKTRCNEQNGCNTNTSNPRYGYTTLYKIRNPTDTVEFARFANAAPNPLKNTGPKGNADRKSLRRGAIIAGGRKARRLVGDNRGLVV